MIKLVASDMDGTLLNNHMHISEKNRASILNLQEKGIRFIIATGRDYDQAAPLLKEQGIRCPIIALNGAKFYDEDGKEEFSHPIPTSDVTRILTMLKEKDIHAEIATSEGIFSDSKSERLNAFASVVQELNSEVTFEEAVRISEEEADKLRIKFVDSYDPILNNSNIRIFKISAYTAETPASLIPVRKQLLNTYSQLAITSFHESNLEINHLDAQKGPVLSSYAKKMGLQANEVMAIGDNLNDVSMLKWAKHSVAMMNGLPEVKKMARHVTSSNEDNGVSKAIERLVFKQ